MRQEVRDGRAARQEREESEAAMDAASWRGGSAATKVRTSERGRGLVHLLHDERRRLRKLGVFDDCCDRSRSLCPANAHGGGRRMELARGEYDAAKHPDAVAVANAGEQEHAPKMDACEALDVQMGAVPRVPQKSAAAYRLGAHLCPYPCSLSMSLIPQNPTPRSAKSAASPPNCKPEDIASAAAYRFGAYLPALACVARC